MNSTSFLPYFRSFVPYFCSSDPIPQPTVLFEEVPNNAKFEALTSLQSGSQEWQRKFIALCNTLNIEQLPNFFSNFIPELTEKLSIVQLKKSIDEASVAQYASQRFTGYLSHTGTVETGKFNYSSQQTWWFNQFISTFLDTFLTSFNFFDGSEPPTTIYEKHVLIQIYYKFFQIPIAISCLLQPVLINAWKVYFATTGILGLISLGVDFYKRFRPFPKVIPHCENVDEVIAKEFQGYINGLEDEMGQLIACLNSNSKKNPIMLLAGTGNGKTTLIYKLYQQIKAGKVTGPLKNKKIVILNGEDIMAKTSMDFGDKIKEINYKLKGFEKDVIVFIDELQAIASNPSCFVRIKKLMRTPGIQFITATTISGLRAIKSVDFDDSFRGSFSYIQFGIWDEGQVRLLLQEIVNNETSDIAFDEGREALNKVIELSNTHLVNLPQPKKAIKLLNSVISTCRTNYDNYQTKLLSSKETELSDLRVHREEIFPHIDSKEEARIEQLIREIALLVQEKSQNLAKSRFLQRLIVIKNELKKEALKDGLSLASKFKIGLEGNEKTQKRFLFYTFYLLPALKEIIDGKVNELKDVMDLKVDAEFVEKVFQRYRVLEENIHNNAAGIAEQG